MKNDQRLACLAVASLLFSLLAILLCGCALP